MTGNKEVLDTERERARIASGEYDGLTKKDVRRIYVEETGEEPPNEIEVYHSQDLDGFKEGKHGFKGTAIHFYDKEKGVNQLYTIPRGTEQTEPDTNKPIDYTYDAMIYSGKSAKQYERLVKFDKDVTKKVKEKLNKKNDEVPDLIKVAVGHSLGANLAETLQLTSNKKYQNVYAINDAPPNYYQLASIDFDFWQRVAKKFGLDINKYNEIYDVDLDKLKKFAEEHYKEKGKDIHHVRTENELMSALSVARGFFDVGDQKMVLKNDADVKGKDLRQLIKSIPDEDQKAIQEYIAKYSGNYNKDGFDGTVKAMTGVDPSVMEHVMNHEYSKINIKDAAQMVKNVYNKLPELITLANALYKNVDPMLDLLEKNKYITAEDRKDIKHEIKGMLDDLKDIEKTASDTVKYSGIPTNPVAGAVDTGLITRAIYKLYDKYKSLKSHMDQINNSTFGRDKSSCIPS